MLIPGIALLTACNPSADEFIYIDQTDEALMMLDAVFESPDGQLAICEMMDTVLSLYDLDLTKDNYLKVGNLLVEKRKESEGSILEMEILAHMIGEYSGKRGATLEEQLNKSVRALEAEKDHGADLKIKVRTVSTP